MSILAIYFNSKVQFNKRSNSSKLTTNTPNNAINADAAITLKKTLETNFKRTTEKMFESINLAALS